MRRISTAYLIALPFALAHSAPAQEGIRPVYELVRPSPRVVGAPKRSDVCFSPRWPRARPGGDPLEMARQFHATRLEWVYLGDASGFCQRAAANGMSVCGSVNSNLPDSTRGRPTYQVGRARDLEGRRVIPDFMRDWGCYWGCANQPEFRRIWLEHAALQIRAGADRIQNDGARLSEGGMLHWGGCYCERCVSGFRRYLSKMLSPARLVDLGVSPVEEFDYGAYLRGHRKSVSVTKHARAQAATLQGMFQDFQRESVLDFYADVHARLERLVGRNVPFSCNNAEGFLLYLHKVHDFVMFEAYPQKEGIPEYFYRERVRPLQELGKPFIITFVSEDVQHTRRMIALSYAFGGHAIAPWDVFTGAESPRVFGDPAEYADLYGFVRSNASLFDGYEEAAVAGVGLDESRPAAFPPIRLRGGTRQVVAAVRAVPGKSQSPVVVHMVDWASKPEPFTVLLDPRRFFGEKPLRVRLLTPASYEPAIHARAVATGDMQSLTVVREYEAGHQIQLEVPALSPWGMLVVESSDERATGLWSPMIWAEHESYYGRHLMVRLDCASTDTTLRYTLDGSEPLASSARYHGPLELAETTVVRARAFTADGQPGPEARADFHWLGARSENRLLPDALPVRKNLRLWISADSLLETQNDGDPVERWVSRAGPAPSVSDVRLPDGQAPSPPLLRTDRINGQPVVEFSDPAHHLDIPRFSAEHLRGKRFTIFMVARSTDLQFGFGGNALSGTGGVPRLYVTRGNLHYDQLRGIPTGAPAGKAAINSYVYDGGLLQTWVNGHPRGQREQAEPVARFGSGGHLAIPFWGASEFHGGEMAELLVFDRALTDAERVDVEAYLADKYGIHDRPKWR